MGPKRTIKSLIFAIVAILGFSSSPAMAAGNNTVTSSNPAAGENVQVPPTQIQLIFQNQIPAVASVGGIGVAMTCEGVSVGLGPVQLGIDRRTISAALTQLPGTGSCAISWSLPDGSAGTVQFSISGGTSESSTTTTSDATGTTTPTSTTPPKAEVTSEKQRVGGPLGLMRVLVYITVAALLGGLLLLQVAWPEGVRDAAASTYFKIVWIAASISMLLYLVLASAQYNNKPFTESLSVSDWLNLMDNNPGRAVIVRTVLVLTAGWMAWKPIRVLDPVYDGTAIIHLLLLGATFGFDRADGRTAIVGYPLGMIHAIAALFLVGGVFTFSRVLLVGKTDENIMQALRSFMRAAGFAIITLVVTGVLQTYRLDGFGILTSSHGRVIAVKLLFSAAAIFIILAVRGYVKASLMRVRRMKSAQSLKLQRVFNLSMIVFALSLAFTSWATTMDPAQAPPAKAGQQKQKYAFNVHLENENFEVRLYLDPATTGPNKLRIELFKPDRINTFHIYFVPSQVTASGIDISVPLERPGAATIAIDGGLKFDPAGTWTIELTGTTTTGDLTPLTTTIDLQPPVTTTTTTTTLPGQTTAPTTTTTSTTTTVPMFTLPD